VLIEAMACGTPVIAFRRGSVPEILEHGRTGLFVDGVEAAARAMREVQVRRLNRWAVRRCFEGRFTAERMARAYVTAYRKVAALPRRPQRVA
jgi:glycosyltransferase involved in cell wall biosynthesis